MKQVLVLFVLFGSIAAFAQDVIVKKDGSTILSKVLEVNTSDIKYKKFSNPNGPTYTIGKSEILAINYENGEKDDFNTHFQESVLHETTNNQINPRMIYRNIASNNKQVISSYNVQIRQTGQPLKKSAPYITAFLGVSNSSVLSNEDIEISFIAHNFIDVGFDIIIENRSDRILYIDKGNCFRVVNKHPYCYYDGTEQTTIGRSGGGGASLGLGSIAGIMGIDGIAGQLASGVNIGGGKSKSTSTTFVTQRVIAIPPHSKKALCESKKVEISNSWYKKIDPFEELSTYETRGDGARKYGGYHFYASKFGLEEGDVKIGQVISYDENNSPYQRVYTITYSDDESFKTYSVVNFTLYLSHVIGKKFWTKKGMDKIEIIKNDNALEFDDAKFK